MRSKTDKAAKTKAPSAKQSATTDAPKKRGRPKKADSVAPVKKAKAAAVKTAKVAKAPKAPKVKLSEKKANALWAATFAKIEQLAQMGAVHIKVDGVEVALNPEHFMPRRDSEDTSDKFYSLGNNYGLEERNGQQTDAATEAEIHQMAKVAPMDNPDEYAEAQDRWANHEPLPRI